MHSIIMPGRPKRKSSASAAIDSRKRAAAVEPVIGSDTSDDDDVPPPPPPLGGSLSWRMSPEDSLSDWMIEIVYETSDGNGNVKSKVDTYHVHKCHLAGGSRKSGYFSKLFSNGGRFAETSANKSRIEFNEIAATKFPDLLDYIYCAWGAQPEITTDNATALSFLSKYFDLPCLRWKVKQFWTKDVNKHTTCGTYYEHAHLLNQSKIREAAIKSCRKNISIIGVNSRLIHVEDASFWLKLVDNDERIPAHHHLQISTLIAAFLRKAAVNEETFIKLTSATALPHIHPNAVLPLLEAERVAIAPDVNSLTSLQRRCIDSLATRYNLVDMCHLMQDETLTTLRSQSQLVLSELFIKLMTAVKGYG
ncbi:hypothetical protein MPSEU_000361700 [Mayamaea pseudoterrestris]|nr:hypothetical protein MPSEU_000361700 [Mayamaea pseudoterrestris]